MMLRPLLISALLVAIAPATIAQTTTTPAKPAAGSQVQIPFAATDTRAFVEKAYTSNRFEIESSQLAISRAESEAVQQFAELMIRDHSKAGDDLARAVAEANIKMPTEIADETDQTLVMMRDLVNTAFDEAYIEAQTKAHQDAVELFSAYAENGPEGPVKQFADDALPSLKAHLIRIREIAEM